VGFDVTCGSAATFTFNFVLPELLRLKSPSKVRTLGCYHSTTVWVVPWTGRAQLIGVEPLYTYEFGGQIRRGSGGANEVKSDDHAGGGGIVEQRRPVEDHLIVKLDIKMFFEGQVGWMRRKYWVHLGWKKRPERERDGVRPGAVQEYRFRDD